jgi:hypothetical protein
MATSKRLAGIAYLKVDGETYLLSGDLAYSVSTVKRETKTGQDTVHGFSETPVPGWISMTVRDSGKLSLADINAMVNITVTAELANDKVILGRNMWSVDTQEVKTAEGTFELKFESASVEEV